MGLDRLVLGAASIRGWSTKSGMEGPSVRAGATESGSGTERISTFPGSLFTKSPRRRMRVAFTCNVCGQRTTCAINPHAYTDDIVFVQVRISLFNSLSLWKKWIYVRLRKIKSWLVGSAVDVMYFISWWIIWTCFMRWSAMWTRTSIIKILMGIWASITLI